MGKILLYIIAALVAIAVFAVVIYFQFIFYGVLIPAGFFAVVNLFKKS